MSKEVETSKHKCALSTVKSQTHGRDSVPEDVKHDTQIHTNKTKLRPLLGAEAAVVMVRKNLPSFKDATVGQQSGQAVQCLLRQSSAERGDHEQSPTNI